MFNPETSEKRESYQVKGTKLHIYVHGFILQLKMASASVVNFCVSQMEILGIEGEGGLPLYLLHPLTLPPPKKRLLQNLKIEEFWGLTALTHGSMSCRLAKSTSWIGWILCNKLL